MRCNKVAFLQYRWNRNILDRTPGNDALYWLDRLSNLWLFKQQRHGCLRRIQRNLHLSTVTMFSLKMTVLTFSLLCLFIISDAACLDKYLQLAPKAFHSCTRHAKLKCYPNKLCIGIFGAYALQECTFSRVDQRFESIIRHCGNRVSWQPDYENLQFCLTYSDAVGFNNCVYKRRSWTRFLLLVRECRSASFPANARFK